MTAPEKRPTPDILQQPRGFHLLGVCGTGMGALAVLLREKGYIVSGSDTGFYPPMSDILLRNNIRAFTGWDPVQLDPLDPLKDIVVVGNVCRRTNEACVAAMERGFCCISQPEALYHFFLKEADHRIVISGTHGKTTTSSLVVNIFESAKREPSFFIGGEVKSHGCGAHCGNHDVFIAEGDEYDTAWFDKVPKFWHYAPTCLCINNIEFDHGDIYKDLDEIIWVFEKLVDDMPKDSIIYYNADDKNAPNVAKRAMERAVGFGLDNGDFRATNIIFHDGGTRFDIVTPQNGTLAIESPMTGRHNVYNVTAACAIALQHGISIEQIQKGIASFLGVKKRQECIGVKNNITVYDDFAHHPTAVRETVRAIRARHSQARLWGIFEMKSNTSRRAIFQHEYPEALAEADIVVLSAPWKKDDLPPELLINIPKIVEDLKSKGIEAYMIPTVDEIVDFVAKHVKPGDVVLGMSGSAFGGFHKKLLDKLDG